MNEQSWIDPNCTREGWPTGAWDGEPDKLQWTDEETGLVCLAKRHPRRGHWCGYVGVEPGHPWHGKGYEDIDCAVHYGLTFSDACEDGDPNQTICHIPEPGKPEHLWWLGFDCAHCDDYSPQDAALARDRGYPFTLMPESSYKTLAWVRNETADLALQARAADTSTESQP